MRSIDIFRLSTRIFKTNKLRTTLTILGISVGIAAILFLVSLGLGLQHILISQIASSLRLLDIKTDSFSLIKLDKENIEKIKSLSGVEDISPAFEVNSFMKIDDLSGSMFVILTGKSFFVLDNIKPKKGNFFTGNAENKIVVSTAALKLFNLEIDEAIGKKAKFSLNMPRISEDANPKSTEDVDIKDLDKIYEIAGVVDDSSKSYAFMPIDSVENIEIPYYTQVKINAKTQEVVGEVKGQLEKMGFAPTAVSDTISDTDRIFQAIQIILSVFGAVALIVSAIGMFNTMTIALLERTQEIGIMKALGASRRDIWKLFLAESVIIGFLGGFFGIMIGFGGTYAVNAGINYLAKSLGGQEVNMFYTPAAFVIFIIVFSSVVGFITGLYPAKRASNLSPLEALRYK